MGNLAVIDSVVMGGAGFEMATDSVGSSRSASSSNEPRRTFADTPPLAKLRAEAKSREVDSSPVAANEEVEGKEEEAVSGAEGSGEFSQSDSEGPSQENPSAEAQKDSATDSTVSAELMLLGQAEPELVIAGQSQGADAQVVETMDATDEAVESDSQMMPDFSTAMEDAQQASMGSQGMKEDAKAAEIEASPTAARDLAGQNLSEAASTAPAQGDEATAKSAQAQATSTAALAEGEGNGSDSGDGTTAAGTHVVGPKDAETHVAAETKGQVVTSANAESTEVVQTQASQQAADDNAGSDSPGGGQFQDAVAKAAQDNSVDQLAQGEQGASRASVDTQDALQEQVVAAQGQSKTNTAAESGDGTTTQAELTIEFPGSSLAGSESTFVQADVTSAAENTSLKSPIQDVGEQILDSVHASMARGDKQVMVRLDPPELGTVTVRFQEQEGQLIGVMEVSKDQTRHEVEQALPEVVRSLQDSGVLVRRVDVVLSDQSQKDFGQESLSQDAWAQQQENADQQDASFGRFSTGRWSTWTTAQTDAVEQNEAAQAQLGVAQDRINMLV